MAVVQTLDFFMPIVDDPKTFGMIAAANSISDVYAMGATPVMALAILGFPTKKIGPHVAKEIMLGGVEVCQRAGIQIAGGHSIDDAEPKFGLSVTGMVHPDEIWRNDAAQIGDHLVLTKPLGIGVMGSVNKKGLLSDSQYTEFVRTTTFLNALPAKIAREVGIHAATDITGFGLIGHTLEMALGSGLKAEIWSKNIPVLSGVTELIEQGVTPGAIKRNRQFVLPYTHMDPDVSEQDQMILADPQTSGGLLFAVSEHKSQILVERLRQEGALAAAIVGQFLNGEGVSVL